MATRGQGLPLRGTTALITGAAGLMGGHLAEVFLGRGAHVVLADVSGDALRERAEGLRGRGGRVEALESDLGDADAVESLVERAGEALAPVDVLVNNAYIEATSRFDSLSREELDAQLAVNIEAPLRLARTALLGMRERGRGHIVNMASLTGKLAFAYKAHYSVSKAGLIAFSHALDRELADDPVGVTVVCPALILEGGVSEKATEAGVDMPRFMATCHPRQVAEAAADGVEQGRTEIVVSNRPTGLLAGLQAAAPSVAWRVLQATGNAQYWAQLARSRGRG
jgi:short-subunit dehydrogenase